MKLSYRTHAMLRMFQRQIRVEDVRYVLETGETIEEYPEDTPFPSRLVLGWSEQRPIHLVIAENALEDEVIIITVYEPDPAQWSDDFRRRLR